MSTTETKQLGMRQQSFIWEGGVNLVAESARDPLLTIKLGCFARETDDGSAE